MLSCRNCRVINMQNSVDLLRHRISALHLLARRRQCDSAARKPDEQLTLVEYNHPTDKTALA